VMIVNIALERQMKMQPNVDDSFRNSGALCACILTTRLETVWASLSDLSEVVTKSSEHSATCACRNGG